MSLRLSHSTAFTSSARQLIAVLLSPAFLEQRHRLQGALEVLCRPPFEQGGRLVLAVECQEPMRTLTGSDPSRPVRTATTYRWDVAARACDWDYRGDFGERLRLGGRIRLAPAVRGCELVSEFEVEVRVPLIGHAVERRIASIIRASVPAFDALLQEHLASGLAAPAPAT